MRRENAKALLFCFALAAVGCVGKLSTPMAGITAPVPVQNPLAKPIDIPWVDGKTYDQWVDQFGVVKVVSSALLGPSLSLGTDSSTSSALVTSAASFGDMTATISETTFAQLQTPAADAWNVGWVLWHYTDNSHFYYILLKPAGWELGKEDPAYPGAQRFLVTGQTPVFPIGVSNNVQITQSGGAMQVAVNGAPLVQFTDTESPYLQGSIGLYCEVSSVTFASVVVNGKKLPFSGTSTTK